MMMCGSLALLLVALSTALAAPAPSFQDNSEQIIVPQKRAALVLDRLLIALQKALHEDSQLKEDREWPRTEPLRIDLEDVGDMVMCRSNRLQPYKEDSQLQVVRERPGTEPLRIDLEDVGDMRDHYEEVQPLSFEFAERDVPSAPATPRVAHDNDVDTSGLQRRGQGGGRGRVLRCYFNAVTCF